MKFLFATFASATLLASGVSAQEPSEPESQATDSEAEADEDRIICKRVQITGSRFHKKLCGTKAEWDAKARAGADATRDMRDRGRGREPPRG